MKTTKVRNKFLSGVSYVLRGLSFIVYLGAIGMMGLRTAAHLVPNFTDDKGTPISELLKDPFFNNLLIFTWTVICITLFAFLLGTMAKLVANVSRDIIFDRINVKFLQRMTLVTFILSFAGGNGTYVDGAVMFLALTLFLFSKILSRAIAIAEEQEFTI